MDKFIGNAEKSEEDLNKLIRKQEQMINANKNLY